MESTVDPQAVWARVRGLQEPELAAMAAGEAQLRSRYLAMASRAAGRDSALLRQLADEAGRRARRLAVLHYLRTGSRITPEPAAPPAGSGLTEQLRVCCQAALEAAALYAVQPLYPEVFRALAAEQQRSSQQLLTLLERRLYGL